MTQSRNESFACGKHLAQGRNCRPPWERKAAYKRNGQSQHSFNMWEPYLRISQASYLKNVPRYSKINQDQDHLVDFLSISIDQSIYFPGLTSTATSHATALGFLLAGLRWFRSAMEQLRHGSMKAAGLEICLVFKLLPG